jgi:hypothetical protein
MKRLMVLLPVALVFGIIAFALATSKGTAGTPVSSAKMERPQPKGMIDGAANPSLVSDQVAYSLLFRMLSNRHTEKDKKLVRSYIRQMDLGNEDKLLAVVEKFEQRVGVLDRKAGKIHEERGPYLDLQNIEQLNHLQRQKEKIVADIVASLTRDLGSEGAEKLRRHVNERVKRKVKMIPEHTHPEEHEGPEEGH